MSAVGYVRLADTDKNGPLADAGSMYFSTVPIINDDIIYRIRASKLHTSRCNADEPRLPVPHVGPSGGVSVRPETDMKTLKEFRFRFLGLRQGEVGRSLPLRLGQDQLENPA